MSQCLVSVLVAVALASRSQAVIVESPAGLWDGRLPQKPQDQRTRVKQHGAVGSREHCKTAHIISVRGESAEEFIKRNGSLALSAFHHFSTHTHHGAYTLERDHTRTANGQCTAPFAQEGTCGSLSWTARRTAPFYFCKLWFTGWIFEIAEKVSVGFLRPTSEVFPDGISRFF